MVKKQADAPGGKGASYAVEMVAIELLSEDPANARKHGDKNVDAIVASLRRFGQQKPIVIDRNNVVRAGNGTLQAARVLGWQSIACYRSKLAGAEMAAYAIADNRTAELAEWDEEILRATLEGLAVDDVELLEAAGYTEDELSQMAIDAMASIDPGDDEDDTNGEQMDESVTVSFPVTVEQEVVFRRAVSAAKKTLNADSTGDAVIKIMEAWNGEGQ